MPWFLQRSDMNLVDILEQKDIDQLGQIFRGLLERAGEIVAELRDEGKLVIEIRFEKIAKGE